MSFKVEGEEGWPLGLPRVTLRMQLVEAFSAAAAGDAGMPFALNATPSFSSLSSSDLDSESTGSFFRDKTMTLGSLIGIARASSALPSLRQSANSVHDTASMMTGSRRLITRFPWCGSESLGPTSSIRSRSWSSLIRCTSCRCTYDYPDDDSSIGAPPSLGHFLQADGDLETDSNNQAKVYINMVFEGDAHGNHERNAINPLFDLGRPSSPNLSELFMRIGDSIVPSPSFRTADAANDRQMCMPRESYGNQRLEATNQEIDLHQSKVVARLVESFHKAAATLLKSKSQMQEQDPQDRAKPRMLGCVSHILGFPKGGAKLEGSENEDDDIESQCSIDERDQNAKVDQSNPMNLGISCYTNYSFDDSDCSVYFDDEDDLKCASSGCRDTNINNDSVEPEFQFCGQLSGI